MLTFMSPRGMMLRWYFGFCEEWNGKGKVVDELLADFIVFLCFCWTAYVFMIAVVTEGEVENVVMWILPSALERVIGEM